MTLFQGVGTSHPPGCTPSWPEVHKSKTSSAFVHVYCLCFSRLLLGRSFLIAATLSERVIRFFSQSVTLSTDTIRPTLWYLLPVQFIAL